MAPPIQKAKQYGISYIRFKLVSFVDSRPRDLRFDSWLWRGTWVPMFFVLVQSFRGDHYILLTTGQGTRQLCPCYICDLNYLPPFTRILVVSPEEETSKLYFPLHKVILLIIQINGTVYFYTWWKSQYWLKAPTPTTFEIFLLQRCLQSQVGVALFHSF